MSLVGRMLGGAGWTRKRGDRIRLGVYLGTDRVWLVTLDGHDPDAGVLRQLSEPMDPERWGDALPALIQQAAPQGASLHIALAPAFYSLVLVDAPDVPAEELREAARWRIRDLIQTPVESLVIDVFALPSDAFRGRLHMIYVAGVAESTVQRLAVLHKDRYPLRDIGVQELALVGVGNRMVTGGSAALLSLERDTGGIHLIESGALYLSRAIDFSGRDSASSAPEGRADRLALDVQRSMDYYESQIGKAPPARLVWFSSASLDESTMKNVQHRISAECLPANLEGMMRWPEPMAPEHQLAWATALGAALAGDA